MHAAAKPALLPAGGARRHEAGAPASLGLVRESLQSRAACRPRPALESFSSQSTAFGACHVAKRRQAPRLRVFARINIDRRLHLEEAFKRQLEAEKRRELMAVSCPVECVREVRTLVELEAELAAAQEQEELVVVDFYNSACGACKDMLPQLITLCKTGALDSCIIDLHEAVSSGEPSQEASVSRIPARFLKHNVRDDYDDLTDIAQLYRIKMVPAFAFFVEGSRIGQLVTRDSSKVAASVARILKEQRESLGKS